MRRFLIGLLATVGFLAIVFVAGTSFLAWRMLDGAPRLPERFVLTADWREGLDEAADGPGLLSFDLERQPTVTDLVLALDRAARDPRVAGLWVRLSDARQGFAVAQELRDAVQRFRAAGKPAVVYADTFGELTAGNEPYYLATAFDEINLQPVGLVGLTGLAVEVPHLRNLLAQLGIRLEVSRRAEYKTVLESFTEAELTPANREMLEALLDTLSGQLVSGIAAGRRLDEARVRALIDQGPFTGEEALQARLVDHIRHADQALAALRRRVGAGVESLSLDDYADAIELDAEGTSRVALITAAGLIRRGGDPAGIEIAADDLAGTLADAAEDDGIQAVLLRIDSGGGSAVASETIARAVRRVIEAGKPVVVSMSNAAASGGYWIAMGASRIVAQPGTLTGSIGVVAGKPMLGEAWDELGVSWAEITRGANATMWSVNQPYTPQARARLETILDNLYGTFKAGVARGRNLPPERVDALAKGRVWAGAVARDLGLVDELGGLDVALAAVRHELRLPDDAPLAIERLPEPESPIIEVLSWLGPRVDILERLAIIIRAASVPATAGSPSLTVR